MRRSRSVPRSMTTPIVSRSRVNLDIGNKGATAGTRGPHDQIIRVMPDLAQVFLQENS